MTPLPKPLSAAVEEALANADGKITPAALSLSRMLKADDRLRHLAAFMLMAIALDEPPTQFFERFCPKGIFDGGAQ
jgi:hypothetical protein